MKTEQELLEMLEADKVELRHWQSREEYYTERGNTEMANFCHDHVVAFTWIIKRMKRILGTPEGETVNDVGRKSD